MQPKLPIPESLELKNLVGPGKMVHFVYFKNSELWYETDGGFRFPVPVSDTGEARFEPKDKAILFMRWIRKYRDEMVLQSCYAISYPDGSHPEG